MNIFKSHDYSRLQGFIANQFELLVYVSDNVKAVPMIKHSEFILSPIESFEKINCIKVT